MINDDILSGFGKLQTIATWTYLDFYNETFLIVEFINNPFWNNWQYSPIYYNYN